MLAISAVDNALWDLRGKLLGLPVYRLLGGPTRASIDCYASMLGHSLDPGLVRERAQAVVQEGYKAQKWFFRYGPSDGLEGMQRNVDLARTVREAAGPNIEIMFDCFMGGDITYVIRLLERIAEYRPRWLEEPVPPDRIGDSRPSSGPRVCLSPPGSTNTRVGGFCNCFRPMRLTYSRPTPTGAAALPSW